MLIIAWVVVGALAGFVASRIVRSSGDALLFDIVIGIVGAVAGGFVGSWIGGTGMQGVNPYSFILAVVGSACGLFVYHAVIRRV